MGRKTKAELVWTLTVLRNGGQGPVGSLEEAEFKFGRRDSELVDSPIRRLSEAISSIIRSCEIEDDALETGFTIEMRMSPEPGRGWRVFSMLAGNEIWGPDWRNPRSVYGSPELEGAVEFVDTGSPCNPYNQLPHRIWIRVTPLTMPIIAWAISNKIYSCPKGDQRTLHDWFEFSSIQPSELPKVLVLPGPPSEEYTFLS